MAELIDQIRPLFRRLRDRYQTALPAQPSDHGFLRELPAGGPAHPAAP